MTARSARTAGRARRYCGRALGGVPPPPLPGSNGLPIQFVIGTTGSSNELDEVARRFMADAFKARTVHLSRQRTQDRQVEENGHVRPRQDQRSQPEHERCRRFAGDHARRQLRRVFQLGRPLLEVIPPVRQRDRLTNAQLLSYEIRTSNNMMRSLATVANLENNTVPQVINHFQQVNAATVSAWRCRALKWAMRATLKNLAQPLPAG